jgi:type IV pilus assembly protein PilB
VSGERERELASRFGARLVERGIVSEVELARALQVASDRSIPLEDALEALGLVTEDQAGALMAEELGVPYVFPYAGSIDPELLGLFPADLLRRHEAVPLVREADQIVVATARVASTEARRELQAAAGVPVAFSLAARRRVERVLLDLFGEPPGAGPGAGARRAGLDDPGAVAILYGHLARAIAGGATEVRFEPGPADIRVRYRQAGRLVEQAREPLARHLALVARAKVLMEGEFQRRRIRTAIAGRPVVLEIAVVETRGGESVLLRISEAVGAATALETDERLLAAARRERGLILIGGPDPEACAAVAYAVGLAAERAGRAVVAIERDAAAMEPGFRQIEAGRGGVGAALGRAAALRPDVLLIALPPEEPAEIGAALRAAGRGLVAAVCDDPDAIESAIGWIERGARPSALARALEALVGVDGTKLDVIEPPPGLREAIERRAAPSEIRRAARGG